MYRITQLLEGRTMKELNHPELHVNEEPRNDFNDFIVGFLGMFGLLFLIGTIATIITLF